MSDSDDEEDMGSKVSSVQTSPSMRAALDKRLKQEQTKKEEDALAEMKAVSTLNSEAIRWMNKRKCGVKTGKSTVKVCFREMIFFRRIYIVLPKASS
jgi:hypothetical protein